MARRFCLSTSIRLKANKLGTVIGTRTWGGIVGISGSLPYMDGTDIRVPFFTNYDAKTGQWIVENHGVDPDILIDNDPIQEQSGVDQQLEKAIEVALEQLKDRKPLPGVPAARTMKDLAQAAAGRACGTDDEGFGGGVMN